MAPSSHHHSNTNKRRNKKKNQSTVISSTFDQNDSTSRAHIKLQFRDQSFPPPHTHTQPKEKGEKNPIKQSFKKSSFDDTTINKKNYIIQREMTVSSNDLKKKHKKTSDIISESRAKWLRLSYIAVKRIATLISTIFITNFYSFKKAKGYY
jgi:hypothetical protein